MTSPIIAWLESHAGDDPIAFRALRWMRMLNASEAEAAVLALDTYRSLARHREKEIIDIYNRHGVPVVHLPWDPPT